jgi:hypothetical protein
LFHTGTGWEFKEKMPFTYLFYMLYCTGTCRELKGKKAFSVSVLHARIVPVSAPVEEFL